MRQIGFLLFSGVITLAGCGDDGPVTDAGGDTGTMDTGTGDAGDTGPPSDTSPTDTSVPPDTGPPPPCAPPALPPLATEEVAAADTFRSPLFVTQAPGNTDTLWVVERGGTIRLVRGDSIIGNFIDVSSRIAGSNMGGDERGLLGMAFHPDYATNGRFFLYYTSDDATMRDVVAEYAVSGDPDVADNAEVRRLMEIPDPESNHNGGMLQFGPDGFLYVGVGDGGGGCDRHGDPGNGQSLDTLFGKILRLDVDNVAGDFAAAGNPFEAGGGLPQIWAYGIRNPWRFSFDMPTGDLYIGDVGQNSFDEIDIQPGASTGGENYGWRFFEADRQSSVSGCDDTGFDTIVHTEPMVTMELNSGREILRTACAITGGYVYRGSAIPALRGVYLFGDSCSTDVAAFRYCEGSVMGLGRAMDLSDKGTALVSFGEDNAGELYMAFLVSGSVHRIIAAP